MRKLLILVVIVAVLLLVSSCAPHANLLAKVPETNGHLAGFWLGLWHGLIILFTFIISLFCDHVNIYEVHNSGGWYNFGFLLGSSICIGSSGSTATKKGKDK